MEEMAGEGRLETGGGRTVKVMSDNISFPSIFWLWRPLEHFSQVLILQGLQLSIFCVVRLLLELGGIARTFFGKYNGTSKLFTLWSEKFLAEHKKVRQEAHTQLMKECGVSGKHFDIPPTDFVPHSLAIENNCLKCNDVFENDKSLKNRIQIEHKVDVKKAYSKEAMEMVVEDNKYMDWLSKTTFVDSEIDKNRISKMQEEN